ncbi:MAG TPA: OFA family MFS transporter [Anaeromyxobacteraceae bacterium]|nr:OFA family MFS transporter [Anaeromyxobacteraceae bacterium]
MGSSSKKGWIVTLAGVGLNLALGILYAWSIFGKQLTEPIEKGGFGWTSTQATLPYELAIACFAIMMVPAGRLQDRLGPRLVATVGAVLTGVGLLVASLATPDSAWPALVGFGLLAGTGFGLGYAAATPAAVKWFGPEKKGLITGLVVGGFGLAPVYIGPLARALLASSGIAASFRILGAAFFVAMLAFAQLIVDPPHVAEARKAAAAAGKGAASDGSWKVMLRSPGFYSLYLQYACAATAGLMIIGHLAKIVARQSGGAIGSASLILAVLAIFNAGGRIVAGVISDRIGRMITIAFVCILQAFNMLFFASYSTMAGFLVGAALVGFNYGACLSLFPATAADQWGTKSLGLNYGILFTAWGVGGVFGPLLAGWIADSQGSYAGAYPVAGMLLALATFLALLSYVAISVDVKQREVTIRFVRPRPAITSAPLERPLVAKAG